jgi:hypothetical protein
MRKPIVASLAAAAVISAGLGAAAASAATPSSTSTRHEQVSVDRNSVRAERDRSGSRDRHSSARHDASRDTSNGREAADR